MMSIGNNTNLQIMKRNKSFVEIICDYQISQRHRRKSCCCDECGKLSTLQYKFMNVQCCNNHQKYKKLRKFQSIESTYMDSYDTNITSKMSIPKLPQIKYDMTQVKQMHNNQSFELNKIECFMKKKRTNSCCCDKCGSITKFQQESRNIALEQNHKTQRITFRIKRNLDSIFRGISPIEKKLVPEMEEDENDPLNCNNAQFKRRSFIKVKQQPNSGRRIFINNGKAKVFSKTNSREFSIKAESNSPGGKKLNLPQVKSSYAKTREILSIYEQHSKFSLKLNNANAFS